MITILPAFIVTSQMEIINNSDLKQSMYFFHYELWLLQNGFLYGNQTLVLQIQILTTVLMIHRAKPLAACRARCRE